MLLLKPKEEPTARPPTIMAQDNQMESMLLQRPKKRTYKISSPSHLGRILYTQKGSSSSPILTLSISPPPQTQETDLECSSKEDQQPASNLASSFAGSEEGLAQTCELNHFESNTYPKNLN
jgi:hypothetical protein